MQNNITLKRLSGLARRIGLIVFVALLAITTNAQTISTAGGTNYNNDFSINNPAALIQTFVIDNTNASARVLTDVSMAMAPYFGNSGASTIKLFYSATSLSGPPTVTTPVWTLIATGNVTVPGALATIPVLSNMSFTIPANTQYRFAIEATKGLAFSVTPIPTPNVFTSGGVSLKLGNFQIAGLNIGFAGVSPTPAPGNTPTFFGGSVTLVPFSLCSGTPAPGNTVSSVSSACPTTAFTLSLQNTTPGTDVTYAWQSSTTGVAGTYNTIPGATSSTLNVTGMTVTTFYRAIVTCGGNSTTSTPVGVTSITCYCVSSATSIDDEDIFNVTFGGLNNSSTCATTAPGAGSVQNLYSNYTGYSGSPLATVVKGATIPLSVQIGTCGGNFGNGTAVFIDYNQNGVFTDAGERVYGAAVTVTGPHIETGNVTIPIGAASGTTRMRVVCIEFSAGTAIAPCGTYTWGETEDYNINIVPPPPCTGTPAPGNTLTTLTSACAVQPFTLSLQNTVIASGLTYQWFSGPSATGPFTPIGGATNATLTLPGSTTPTFYQATVTCSGNVGTSTPVQVVPNIPTQCYCVSAATSVADEEIFRVNIGDLNNISNCTTLAPGTGSILNRYSNYSNGVGAPAAPELYLGTTMPMTVQIGTCGGAFGNSTAVYIDFNQDGTYQPAERVYISAATTTGAHLENFTVNIPSNATNGITGMRVITVEAAPGTITPCGTYTWGETEDYNVNIVPCVAVTVTAQPTNKTAVCGSSTLFSAGIVGSGRTYQWQVQTTTGGIWTNLTNTAPYSGVNRDTLIINPVATGMNGYNYRVVYSGACTGTSFTNAASLTVTPITIAVTPAAVTKCLAAAPVLLTVPANSQTVTFTSNFGAGGFLVPDGPAGPGPIPGVNTSLAVSGIPIGATIQNISVKINMTQTYVGDMIVNLKSPTSTATTGIINLFALLDGGTGTNNTDNFTNTTISSSGVNALSGAPAPRTGTFRADAFITTSPPLAAALPSNGGAANVNTWASLLSTTNANGNWTLFLADAGAGDTAVLADWSISITYGGAPSTAVFTPSTGLFTNAAGTTPYTGTPVTQVYAAPLATTTYSAVVSSGACSTAPQSIVVTVNTPVAGTATLNNVSTCQNGNATFALGGTLTGGPGFVHQYQVSTNNGASFTNITNGGVYSGANTNTLTLTNVPLTFNGYRFRDSISTGGNCGSLISTVGILTVNPTPVVTINAAPIRNLFPGLTTTLTAAVSPNATGAAYQWFRNGSAVAGANTNRLVVGIDALGTYSVRVTDANGCVSTAASTTPSTIVIGDSSNLTKLFIYPSPNNGQFQVRFFNDVVNNGQIPGVINVYDSKGSRVFSRAYAVGGGYQAMNVDLGASHGKGIYRIDLLTNSGERIKTGTVIVF